MRGIAKTCRCGRLVEGPGTMCDRCKAAPRSAIGRCLRCFRPITEGLYCDACAPARSEAERNASQPYRRHYGSSTYRRNRKARYLEVDGRCEDCGIPLKGELFPDGVPGECDHGIPVRVWAARGYPGDPNDIKNLHWRCLPCHHAKTAAQRKTRRKPEWR